MADLASTDVTVTKNLEWRSGEKRYIRCSIAFGDGAKTYPTGGVPLPAYSSFGMKTKIDTMWFDSPAAANGYVYKYDDTDHDIRIYEAGGDGAELDELAGGSSAPAAATLEAVVVGY